MWCPSSKQSSPARVGPASGGTPESALGPLMFPELLEWGPYSASPFYRAGEGGLRKTEVSSLGHTASKWPARRSGLSLGGPRGWHEARELGRVSVGGGPESEDLGGSGLLSPPHPRHGHGLLGAPPQGASLPSSSGSWGAWGPMSCTFSPCSWRNYYRCRVHSL